MKILALYLLITTLQVTIAMNNRNMNSKGDSGARNSASSRFKKLGNGYKYVYRYGSSTEYSLKCHSTIECASICLQSDSVHFSYDSVSRVCKVFRPDTLMTVDRVNYKPNLMAFYKVSEWTKVYALTMSTGAKVLNSFLNKYQPSSWNVLDCRYHEVETVCPNYFRHPILEAWDQIPIAEVKFEIYKAGSVAAYVIFDGSNSTIKNWFSQSRIKTSSWSDLTKSSARNLTMESSPYPFHIFSRANDCPTYSGWMAVLTSQDCSWNRLDFYPGIIYSSKTTQVKWSEGADYADAMAIYIRLKD